MTQTSQLKVDACCGSVNPLVRRGEGSLGGTHGRPGEYRGAQTATGVDASFLGQSDRLRFFNRIDFSVRTVPDALPDGCDSVLPESGEPRPRNYLLTIAPARILCNHGNYLIFPLLPRKPSKAGRSRRCAFIGDLRNDRGKRFSFSKIPVLILQKAMQADASQASAE